MPPAYMEEELRHFKEELAAWETELNAKAQHLSQESKALGSSQGCLEAQKRELHQVVLSANGTEETAEQGLNAPAPGPREQLKFHPHNTDDTPVPAPACDQKDASALEKKVPEQPQLDSSACDPLGSWHSGSHHTDDGRVVKHPNEPAEDSMCGPLGEVGQDCTSHIATQASYLLPELPQSPSLLSLLSVPLQGPIFSRSIGHSQG